MSCSSLKQDSGLTLTEHFSTELGLRSRVKVVTVILTGPTTIRQRQGGRIRPQVMQDYQKSQEKQGMMLNVDLPIVWSRT